MQPGDKFESDELINISAHKQHLDLRMGADIFTVVCDIHAPHKQEHDVVHCHFEDGRTPA